jgi:hypothetical protein
MAKIKRAEGGCILCCWPMCPELADSDWQVRIDGVWWAFCGFGHLADFRQHRGLARG